MKKFKIKTLYSKGTLIGFALLYSFLVMLGSTFSWVTSANQKVNEFAGETGMKTVIYEDFVPKKQWKPGESVTKIVSIHNDGKSSVFARVSFEEVVKAMKTSSVSEPYKDPAQEGVTPEFCMTDQWDGWEDAGSVFDAVEFLEESVPMPKPSGVVVKVSVSPAGTQRNRYAIYQVMDGGQSFRRMTALFSVHNSGGTSTLTVRNARYWGYEEDYEAELEATWGLMNKTSAAATPPAAANIGKLICSAASKVNINYANLIVALNPDVNTDAGKWFYNETDGFFYYIGKLTPGSFSAALMTGLTLAADADIRYSSMKLQFIVNLQALQVQADALKDDWGLGTSSQLYAHLSSFC